MKVLRDCFNINSGGIRFYMQYIDDGGTVFEDLKPYLAENNSGFRGGYFEVTKHEIAAEKAEKVWCPPQSCSPASIFDQAPSQTWSFASYAVNW